MDAKALVRAMISQLVILGDQAIIDQRDAGWRSGMFDMVVHAVHVAHDMSLNEAYEYVAEEIQERICALAD